MHWIYRFGAKQWTPHEIAAMMQQAFEVSYDKDTRHGPFVVTNVQYGEGTATIQFSSEWERIKATYFFDYSESPYIKIAFSVTKRDNTTPNIDLSYPQTSLNQIPYELIQKTFELLDSMDDDGGGPRENVPQPKSPTHVTASTEESDDVGDFIRQFRQEQLEREFKKNPGAFVYKYHGVWQYPFSEVKKSDDGYYIDWFDNPGSIRYLEEVNVGDKVADHALNMTPYWEVNFVDTDKGQIWLNPIEPNPYITGRGAGGAEWGEHDTEVSSGGYERRRTDEILGSLKKGEVTSPRDVAYILKGTVPVHIGPNLSQGGWYSVSDLSSNRGGREGMNAKQIQALDALSLKRMGFQVPQLALEGNMDMEVWCRFVDGSSINPSQEDPKFEQLKLPDEDWNNPEATAKFILENPVPEVKMRNWNALKQIVNPFPVRKRHLDEGESYDTYYEQRDKLIQEWRAGNFLRKDMLPFMHDLCKKVVGLQHPKAKYDPYWLVKEGVMDFAQTQGWQDILLLFTQSRDFNVRESLVNVLERDKNKGLLLEMLQTENRAKVMQDILNALRHVVSNDELKSLINSNLDRIQNIIITEQDGPYKWAAKDLERFVGWASRTAESSWFLRMAAKEFITAALPDDPERRKRTKWRQAPKLGRLLIGSAGSSTDICIYQVIKSTEIPQIIGDVVSDEFWLDGIDEFDQEGDTATVDKIPGMPGSDPITDNINRMKDIINREDSSHKMKRFDPARDVPVRIIDILSSDVPGEFMQVFKIGDRKAILIGATCTSFYQYVNTIGGMEPDHRIRLIFGDIPRILAKKYPQLIGGDLKQLVPEYQSYMVGEYNVMIISGGLLNGSERWMWYVPEIRVSSRDYHKRGQPYMFVTQQEAIASAEDFISQFSPG